MATNNTISSDFGLYLRFSNGAALTAALANSYGWHVNWAAINGTVQAVKKYYDAGGTRIALRDNGQLRWLLGDHLGSTSYTANGTTEQGEVRYKPWGSTRYSSGTTPTTYRYTGQREEAALGLYYYGARWYDPALGRFIQPDTIVPDPGDAKAFDRYAYVNNNPVRYNDPTGHCADGITTVICAAGAGALAGGVIGGGWYLANEAWYGDVDLVDITWSKDSWVPGIHSGEDLYDLGVATSAGAVAGAATATGAVIATGGAVIGAIGMGASGNLVADHLGDSLLGTDFDWKQHTITGLAGGVGGAVGGFTGSVVERLTEGIGVTGWVATPLTWIEVAGTSAVAEAATNEVFGPPPPDPRTVYKSGAWNAGGEALNYFVKQPTATTLGGKPWGPTAYQAANILAWKVIETAARTETSQKK